MCPIQYVPHKIIHHRKLATHDIFTQNTIANELLCDVNKRMNGSPVKIDWSNGVILRYIVSLDCVYHGRF